MTATEPGGAGTMEFWRASLRPRAVQRARATCGLLSLVAASGLAAQDQPEAKPAPRKPDFRAHLLATLDAWLARRLPASTDLEVQGAIRSLQEIRERAAALAARDKTERTLALAMADDVISRVLEDALRASGHWQHDGDFEAVFMEHRAQYLDSPFGMEAIARSPLKGFPNLDAYRRRFRLLHAFEQSIDAQIDQDTLRAHSRTGPFFANQTVQVSILQFAPQGEGGEARAAERGRVTRDAWAGGASYHDLAKQADLSMLTPRWMPGQVRELLRESEYTDLLAHSVTADILWHAKQGEVVGPLRGVDAYWVVRVEERRPAHPPLALDLAHVRKLVRQDYVQQRFHAWASSVLDRAVLRVHAR